MSQNWTKTLDRDGQQLSGDELENGNHPDIDTDTHEKGDNYCDHCGTQVSQPFSKVFRDEDGDMYACQECSANAGIAEKHMERKYSQ